MHIKLTKSCTWGGHVHKSGTIHDLEDRLANKLIDRGYAKLHDPKSEPLKEDVKKDADLTE